MKMFCISKGLRLMGLSVYRPFGIKHRSYFQIDANNAANQEFKNGLKAGGFLKTGESRLNDQQRERHVQILKNLKLKMRASLWCSRRAWKWSVLETCESAPKTPNCYKPLFGIEEICRTFATPPQMIYHTDKASSWASSLEGMKLGYLRFRRPNLQFEQQISKNYYRLLTPQI